MRATIDIPRTATARFVEGALEGLSRVAEEEVAAGGLPPLYRSGVRYRRERGTEDWLTPRQVAAVGAGDCEDLAAWRVGELRATGTDPDARVIVRQTGPRTLHALVARGDGRLEDPSAVLGMPTRGGGIAEPRIVVGRDAHGAVAALMRRSDRPEVVVAQTIPDAVLGLVGEVPVLDTIARGAKGAIDALLAPSTGPAPSSAQDAAQDWTMREFQSLASRLAKLVQAEARAWSRRR